METKERFIDITLNVKQVYFLKNSLDMLLSTLASMDYTDKLMKYSKYVRPFINMLDNIAFTEHLKSVTLEIDEVTAEAACHGMYSMIQTLFGMGGSEQYDELKEIQKSIWEQIYDKFEKLDKDAQSDSHMEPLV